MAEILANGIKTNIMNMGSGEKTVVFVHGIVVDNMSGFYFTLANAMAKENKLLLYDLRGHGRTERPCNGYDLDTLMDDLSAVMKVGGVSQPVYLLGHSYGGLISIAYAARTPEQLAGLILIDPPLPLENWGEKISEVFSVGGEKRDRYIHDAYDSLHGDKETRKRKRMEQTITALLKHTQLIPEMKSSRSLTEQEISGITCPVLAIYGDESEILDHAKTMKRLIPQTDIRFFEGCTHRVLFEETEKVRNTILNWLKNPVYSYPEK